MAAQNWHQKFLTNPITSNQNNDLLYFARSPYGATDDAVINWQNFSGQFLLSSLLTTKGDLLTYSTQATRLGVGSNGQILQAQSAAATGLQYTTATYPATTTANQLLYSSSNNTIAGLSSANKAVLTTNGSGAPSLTAIASDGQLIIGSTSGVPAAATLTSGTGISITNGSNSISIASTAYGKGYPFAVSTVSGEAPYTTIASAITAANAIASSSTPQTVWIYPGTYTESLTLKPYVSLAALNGGPNNVIISGTNTFTPAADNDSLTLSNITLTSSVNCLIVGGTHVCNVYMINCGINTTVNGAGITVANSSANLSCYNCTSNATSSGTSYTWSATSANNLSFYYCNFVSSAASAVNSTTAVTFYGGSVTGSITSGAAVQINVYGTAWTAQSTAACFSITGTLNIYNATVNSSSVDTYWATGAGTINYDAITPVGSAAAINPTLTSSGKTLSVGNITASSLTASQALITSSTKSLSSVSLTDGQLIVGSSSGAPAAANLTPGTGISISNGNNSITINATGGTGLTWNNVSGTTQTAAANNGYIISNNSQTTVSIPATIAQGSVIGVAGFGTGGFILQANTGQTIHYGSTATSSGGTLTSTNQYNSVTILCVVADTTFTVIASQGNLTAA